MKSGDGDDRPAKAGELYTQLDQAVAKEQVIGRRQRFAPRPGHPKPPGRGRSPRDIRLAVGVEVAELRRSGEDVGVPSKIEQRSDERAGRFRGNDALFVQGQAMSEIDEAQRPEELALSESFLGEGGGDEAARRRRGKAAANLQDGFR